MSDLRKYEDLLKRLDLPHTSRKGTLAPVLGLVDTLPRGRALDAPSGPGAFAGALLEMGFDVSAGDLDGEAFALHGKVDFHQLDLDATLPFDDARFELIHCGDGIEHLENPFHLMREFARILSPGGTLIVATPNYLSVRRRLRFLFSGALESPLERRPDYASGPKIDRGHINPVTLTRMAYMAENAGLELVDTRMLLRKSRHVWLGMPLALWIRAVGALRSAEDQHRLFFPHTSSFEILVGGRKLVAVFEKPS